MPKKDWQRHKGSLCPSSEILRTTSCQPTPQAILSEAHESSSKTTNLRHMHSLRHELEGGMFLLHGHGSPLHPPSPAPALNRCNMTDLVPITFQAHSGFHNTRAVFSGPCPCLITISISLRTSPTGAIVLTSWASKCQNSPQSPKPQTLNPFIEEMVECPMEGASFFLPSPTEEPEHPHKS